MCRGLLSVLSAVCFSGLLPAAAPVQPAGGDQLVRVKDGDFTLRLPASWKTEVNQGGVDAFGDGISMLLSASTQQGGIAYSGAYTMRNWKGVSSEDDTAIIGDSPKPAPIRVFHGAGNGILTIARGTLPLAIFGPRNYGYRLGLIGAPARMAQAAAPLAFGLLIDAMGSRVLIVSSALSLSALLSLLLLRQQKAVP